MADDDSWCFDSESSAMHHMNSSAFPDGSLLDRGFLGNFVSRPPSSINGDDFGELEQALDRALETDSQDPTPESLQGQS